MVRCAFMASLASRIDRPYRSPSAPVYPNWQAALADAVRDPAELCRLLDLDPLPVAAAEGSAAKFSMLVPRAYMTRIRPGDPKDPLLLQVLPQAIEQVATSQFCTDPLGETEATIAPGLLAKYRGRSLIVTTGACAVHCRFCFRRHFPYCSSFRSPEGRELLLRQIAAERSIHEVILSGGDPLALSDGQLSQFSQRLAEIPHLRRIRVHTRFPVAIPQRVTEELVAWLRSNRLSSIVVVQVNHPAEIDRAVAAALGRLVDAGVPVLNQAVLLRGVNDRPDVLAELCERLIDIRVMPYYLHQLDRVTGVAHFEVPEATGARLIEQLRVRLPGYAVPRYVRETAGGAGKEVLA